MYEDAREINEYLPVDAGIESLYIKHLWDAFEAVMEKEDHVRPFGILPFHLLFMFAVQYKVHRLSAYNKTQYLEILRECRLYDGDHMQMLESNPPIPNEDGVILGNCSAKNLSLIRESQLFNFLKIIDVGESIIMKAKELVEMRGNYAHANGKIEENIEIRIDEYLSVLEGIQVKLVSTNDIVADEWLQDVSEGDNLKEFVNMRLFRSHVCRADFRRGVLTLFNLEEETPLEDWETAVSKALATGSRQSVLWVLQYIAKNHYDKDRRLKVVQMLGENQNR